MHRISWLFEQELSSPFVLKVKLSSSVLTGASWYLLEKSTRLIGAFLIGAWVARYLGPENYGVLAYALALVALLGFLGSWGIESLIVRDLVHENHEQRKIISTYFFIRLAGASFVPLLAIGYLAATHPNDQILLVVVLICSGSVILGAFDAVDCWLQARQKAKVTSSIRLLGFITGAVFKCLMIISEANIIWFATALIIESGVMAALYFNLLRHYNLTPSFHYWSFVEFKRIFFDGKMMALSALTVTIYSKIDILVIGTLFPKEVLAPYAIAASMSAAWSMVGMSLVQAWAPRISSAIIIGRNEYIHAFRQMIFFMLGLSIIGSIFLYSFSDFIFDILLGEQYAEGVPIFNVLIWTSIFVFCGVATSQIIVNEKIYWVSLFRTFVGVSSSLLFIIPISSNHGVIGVAWLVVFSSAAATLSIIISSSARKTLWDAIAFSKGFKK